MSSAPETPAPRRGLGRGLEVLVGGGAAADAELIRLPLDAIVPRSVRLAEAPSHGLPAIAYDRSSSGAQAYWKVAMELVERS